MTTKVMIVNHGPDAVVITTTAISSNPSVDTLPSGGITLIQRLPPFLEIVEPGAFLEKYVHLYQNLVISELRTEKE